MKFGTNFSTILLLNGPEVKLTKIDEKTGNIISINHKEIEEKIETFFRKSGFELDSFHSCFEEELVEWFNDRKEAGFMLLNPGTVSWDCSPLCYAILGTNIPFIEIQFSNIHQSESFNHHSCFSDSAIGILTGMGLEGYMLGAEFAADYLTQKSIKLH